MTESLSALRGSMARQERLTRLFALVMLIVLAAVFSLPLIITLGDSLKSFIEVYEVPRKWIPNPPRFGNYLDIFRVLPLHRFLLNTVAITGLALIGQVASACLVGYSFARIDWPFRDFFFVLLLSTMMLPQQVTLIPVFILFQKLGWVDTWLPLIVPAWFGGSVFNVFLMRQFFMTIPLDLEDAAQIDGSSTLRTFASIIVPLSKPAVATITILSFIAYWNDFQNPLIFLSDYMKYPISLGIYMFKTAEATFAQYVMAASLVSVVPVAILFLSAQQYFVKGIVLTGVKA